MKVLDIAFKDLVRSFRSVFAVGMMLVAPLLITGLIYFAFGGIASGSGGFSITATKVALVNLDEADANGVNMGNVIAQAIGDPQFKTWFEVTEMPDEASARAAVDRREAGVAVIIPAGFTRTALSAEGRVDIRLIQDPTLTIGPGIVRDVISQIVDGIAGTKIAVGVVSDQLASIGATLDGAALQSLAMQYSAWAAELGEALSRGTHPALSIRAPQGDADQAAASGFGAQLLTGVMAGQLIFFAFYTGAFTAQSILREDEEGTLARLSTTPTPRAVILGGKFLGVFVTVIVQAVVLMTASALVFRLNWGGPLPVAVAVLGLVIVASGFGVFLLSLIKSVKQAGAVIGGVLAATGMLGGLFTVGVPNMPEAFNTITLLMPQGWVWRAWKAALSGGSLGDVLLPVIVVAGLGALFFVLGVWRFNKRYA